MKIAIAGGGLAGLALGHHIKHHIKKEGADFEILEKGARVGGLLRSETHQGYIFDTGGSHIMFSKDESILREMVNLVGNVVMHRRITVIHYRGKFIKYPFENGIFMLSPQERFEILLDFVNNLAKEKKKPENLKDFFVQLFGEKIVNKYLGPYNEKIWKRNIENIAMAWSDDRLPKPPVEDVLRATVGIETEGYVHQLRFFYPLNGGIESITRRLGEELKENIKVGNPVRRIKPEEEGIEVNGKFYDYLISAIPLPSLLKILGGDLEKFSNELDYNSVTVVGLGVRGNLPDYHWAYIPDKDIIFHRIAFLSNYSPNMAPENRGNIIAEISHRPGEEPKDVIERTIEGLEKIGIDVEVEIAKKWVNHYAYVVTDKNYFKILPEIRKRLEEKRILTLGRHGNWEYLNMDAVWKRAKEMSGALRGIR